MRTLPAATTGTFPTVVSQSPCRKSCTITVTLKQATVATPITLNTVASTSIFPNNIITMMRCATNWTISTTKLPNWFSTVALPWTWCTERMGQEHIQEMYLAHWTPSSNTAQTPHISTSMIIRITLGTPCWWTIWTTRTLFIILVIQKKVVTLSFVMAITAMSIFISISDGVAKITASISQKVTILTMLL